MFTTDFPRCASEVDEIMCTIAGIRYIATLHRDIDADSPDMECDGYWPSLDPKDAGYIGPKSKSTLRRHMKRAQAVLDAWIDGEWFYVGVAVSAYKPSADDTDEWGELTDPYDHALWRIECNYPATRGRHPNTYLREVANELLPECQVAAIRAVMKGG